MPCEYYSSFTALCYKSQPYLDQHPKNRGTSLAGEGWVNKIIKKTISLKRFYTGVSTLFIPAMQYGLYTGIPRRFIPELQEGTCRKCRSSPRQPAKIRFAPRQRTAKASNIPYSYSNGIQQYHSYYTAISCNVLLLVCPL